MDVWRAQGAILNSSWERDCSLNFAMASTIGFLSSVLIGILVYVIVNSGLSKKRLIASFTDKLIEFLNLDRIHSEDFRDGVAGVLVLVSFVTPYGIVALMTDPHLLYGIHDLLFLLVFGAIIAISTQLRAYFSRDQESLHETILKLEYSWIERLFHVATWGTGMAFTGVVAISVIESYFGTPPEIKGTTLWRLQFIGLSLILFIVLVGIALGILAELWRQKDKILKKIKELKEIGILAYGSLIDDPGAEIESSTVGRIGSVQTPFKLEFARSSRTRNDGPTLVPVEEGGAHVEAQILILKKGIPEKQAADMLWRRETQKVGSWEVYERPISPNENSVLVERLENFHNIDLVLYTRIEANIDPLTAQNLAQRAIVSAKSDVAVERQDGISYLINAKKHGIQTPLMLEYEKEILQKVGAKSLEDAHALCRKVRNAK